MGFTASLPATSTEFWDFQAMFPKIWELWAAPVVFSDFLVPGARAGLDQWLDSMISEGFSHLDDFGILGEEQPFL